MPGSSRLEHALRRAEASGNSEAWLQTALALRRVGAPAPGWEAVVVRVETWRAGLRSVGGRIWAGQLVEHLTADLARERLEDLGDPAEVLALTETLRARTLLDEVTLPNRAAAADTAVRIDEIEAELMQLSQKTGDDLIRRELALLSELPLNREPHAGYARLRVEELERLHREHDAGMTGSSPVAGLAEVQSALDPGELLVSYFVPYHATHPAFGLWAIAANRDGATVVRCPVEELPGQEVIGRFAIDGRAPLDVSPLGSLVAEARAAIQRVDDPRADVCLVALDALLLAPLRAAGVPLRESSGVIVAPHRMLHAVPWLALRDASGRSLVGDGPVGLTPSASVLTALRGREPIARASYLGVADPALSAALPELEQARAEVAEVASHLERAGLPCVVREGPAATEAALRRDAPGTAIVHLATHATFPTHEAFDAHLLELAPGNGHDGHVRADEVRSMDFSQAWLTILSVCDGGLLRFGPAGEPYGLVRALLTAGCHNVVAALWEIDDAAGRAVIGAMGAALPGIGPCEALAAAVSPLVEPWPAVDWAGFVAIGACR